MDMDSLLEALTSVGSDPGMWLVLALALLVANWLRGKVSLSSHDTSAHPGEEGESSTLEGKIAADGEPDPSTAAALAWANEWGRYKHCGLRPDPMASADAPVYSETPLPLALPKLSEVELAKLEALGERLQDLVKVRRKEPAVLLRYLRARKWNVKAAEKYFRAAADWREAHDVDNVFNTWNLEAYEKCLAPWWLSGGMFGHGLRGEPVAFERLPKCEWPTLIESLPWEDIVKLDIVHCMRALAALEEDSLRTDHPLGDGILVQDAHGFGQKDMNFKAARALSIIVSNRNQIIPECLNLILVVRAPKAWVYAWTMFKYLLDPGIVEKVRVVEEKNTLAELRKFISNDNIPAYLGGGRRIEGDPECRKVLAPGALLPEEAKERFLQLKARGGGSRLKQRPAFAEEGESDQATCGVCPRRSETRQQRTSCF
jgi:hypothetical protein